jgi:hypothetical protein
LIAAEYRLRCPLNLRCSSESICAAFHSTLTSYQTILKALPTRQRLFYRQLPEPSKRKLPRMVELPEQPARADRRLCKVQQPKNIPMPRARRSAWELRRQEGRQRSPQFRAMRSWACWVAVGWVSSTRRGR